MFLKNYIRLMKFNQMFFKTNDYLSVTSIIYFSEFFRRNVLCSKVIFALCFFHVFAIELTLQENLVKTGQFRRKIVSIERTIC